MSDKNRKRALTAFEAIVKDATPEQVSAFTALCEALLVDGSPAASPNEEESPSPVKAKKGKGKKDASPEEDSPAESPEEDSPAESPDEDDSPSSPEESPAESPSPVKAKKGKGKKNASPEDDSPAESPDEESSPAESPDEDEASPDEESSPAESPSPVKAKKGTKKEVEVESDTPNYKKMDEKALYKHGTTLSDDEDFLKALKAVKTNKPKLLKMLKAFDEQVAEYAGMSLSKLEKIRDKQKMTVSYGRGRSSDEKKVSILAKALAVAAITA